MLVAEVASQRVEARRNLPDANYVCPDCRQPVILKRGRVKVAHFAHSAPADCSAVGESIRHLLAKAVLAEKYRELDYRVVLEERHPERRRRIDLAVYLPEREYWPTTYPPRQFAVEVQDSPISPREMVRRQNADLELGFSVPTVWIFTGQRADPFLSVPDGGQRRIPPEMLHLDAGLARGVRCLDASTKSLWHITFSDVVRPGRAYLDGSEYGEQKLKNTKRIHRRQIGYRLLNEADFPVQVPSGRSTDNRHHVAQNARDTMLGLLSQSSMVNQDEIELGQIGLYLALTCGWTGPSSDLKRWIASALSTVGVRFGYPSEQCSGQTLREAIKQAQRKGREPSDIPSFGIAPPQGLNLGDVGG